MKPFPYILSIFLLTGSHSFAQPSVPFACPGQQVIAYKLGTNCTAASYNFYTIDLSGVRSATPFYTITNTSKEVNGLGINAIDGFLYGIEFDRAVVGASCAFSNYHLVRYDAAGSHQDLGLLPAPAGGVVLSAMGCVSRQGDFIYSVIDASGNRNIAQILSIATLPPAGTLTANYKVLSNSCVNASFADWAIHPNNDKLYSYGIYDNGGVATGTVIEIDPATGVISCTGSPNSTTFLDVARDNFGGIYFVPAGYLYGVNSNTRKLYQIDISTGAVTYISTMGGSSQVRADMGSCTNGGMGVLPVKFKSVAIKITNHQPALVWEMGDAEEINQYIIEKQQGNGFISIGSVAGQLNKETYSYSLPPSGYGVYRVSAVLKNGNHLYSRVVSWKQKNDFSITLRNNPVVNNVIELDFTGESRNSTYKIINATASIVQQGTIEGSVIAVSNLKPGLYFLSVNNARPLKVIKF